MGGLSFTVASLILFLGIATGAEEPTIEDAVQFIQNRFELHGVLTDLPQTQQRIRLQRMDRCSFKLSKEYSDPDNELEVKITYTVNLGHLDSKETSMNELYIGGREVGEIGLRTAERPLIDWEICDKDTGRKRRARGCGGPGIPKTSVIFGIEGYDTAKRVMNAFQFWIKQCAVKEKF